jgi:hypothetical protein
MYCRLQNGQLKHQATEIFTVGCVSVLNADSHRLMQIISGLQNFDRSSVASVVTAADKVLMMHLSFNVYYFVLADFFETKYVKNEDGLVPCKDNMKMASKLASNHKTYSCYVVYLCLLEL